MVLLQPVALALIVFAVAVINCTADENWLRYERIIHARRCAQRHGQGRGQAVRCPGYIPAFFRSGTVSGARPAAPRRGRQRLDSHLSQALQRKIHLTSLKKKVHVTSALGEKPNEQNVMSTSTISDASIFKVWPPTQREARAARASCHLISIFVEQ